MKSLDTQSNKINNYVQAKYTDGNEFSLRTTRVSSNSGYVGRLQI